MRTLVIALDGVLDSSFSLTSDILVTANRLCERAKRPLAFRFEVAGVLHRRLRTGAGHKLAVEHTLREVAASPQLVIVPGWNEPRSEFLLEKLGSSEARCAVSFLRRAHARGAIVTASCTAAFLLAETGLLDGAVATTSWWLAPAFRARYPRVDLRCDLTVAKADRLFTAGAALSQVDLMLGLVCRFAGPRIARLCIRYLALETHPTQARYMMAEYLAHDSPEVSRAETWIRGHLAERFSIADVAKATHTSTRTLARRIQRATGASPLRFVQRLRVEYAAQLLETTDLRFDEIAYRVGYEEPAALRRVIKRELGRGPRDLRAS